MSNLPVREMVLYKNGVGFFRRGGKVTGDHIKLTFRQDDINDVLKSLAVFDIAGGKVLGIHYQTPMDIAARLASSSIRLSDYASMRDLLRDLRGREVVLEFETVLGEKQEVEGRVIGLDEPHRDQSPVPSLADAQAEATLSLLVGGKIINVYPLHALRAVMINDEQAEHDLVYFLDTSVREDERRAVEVRLSEGKHDLVVHYVAPAPTWRVSYRVVAEADPKAPQAGKLLLQGWGLFDNRLEEDLDNVKVTLVAGQPISFIYDLYASKIPQRPTVQDEARVAPKPVEYQAARRAAPMAAKASTRLGSIAANYDMDARFMAAEDDSVRLAPSMKEAAESVEVVATGKETGEFFQYAVTTPVTVKRGASALVPILGAEVQYERELLYNGAKLRQHPTAALRFKNTTGLTLERGPVTLVEDGDYKGEAIVPFTKPENDVYLPYAVELGIKVTEHTAESTEIIGLRIQEKYLIYDQYHITVTTYTVENTTLKDFTVTVEAGINTLYEIFDTPTPEAETATERRWRVTVKAQSSAQFVRRERRLVRRYDQLTALTYQNLKEFMDKRWLDQTTLDQLRGLLDLIAQLGKWREQQSAIAAERETLYKQQEQLRENLKTLQPNNAEETALRGRMLSKLETSQTRLDDLEAREAELARQILEGEKQEETMLTQLGTPT